MSAQGRLTRLARSGKGNHWILARRFKELGFEGSGLHAWIFASMGLIVNVILNQPYSVYAIADGDDGIEVTVLKFAGYLPGAFLPNHRRNGMAPLIRSTPHAFARSPKSSKPSGQIPHPA